MTALARWLSKSTPPPRRATPSSARCARLASTLASAPSSHVGGGADMPPRHYPGVPRGASMSTLAGRSRALPPANGPCLDGSDVARQCSHDMHRRQPQQQQQRWYQSTAATNRYLTSPAWHTDSLLHHPWTGTIGSIQGRAQPLGSHRRPFSALTCSDLDSDSDAEPNNHPSSSHDAHDDYSAHPCHPRLRSLRNVGIFAHVDAGKTTVTERMLALSGLVREAGSVDDGDTVTDYLPAERERGITIQSAAVGFEWVVPPTPSSSSNNNATTPTKAEPKRVAINLIDTPGHVDFSVEVHRSVAVLDGAVLVVDAVAGVQAQTETVWRAIRNADRGKESNSASRTNGALHGTHAHEPLPAVLFVNKMDREGADFRNAMGTVRGKLRGSNPVAVQLPLYRVPNHGASATAGGSGGTAALGPDVVAGTLDAPAPHGEFVGAVDLVNMRALIYPPGAEELSIEEGAPTVISLTSPGVQENNPQMIEAAQEARRDLISHLADVDEIMEDLYLHAMEGDEDDGSCAILNNISTEDVQSSLRRTALNRTIMPTLCGAALRGVGVEPVLDCVAEYLPCPLDRLPPQLQLLGNRQYRKETPNRKEEKRDESNNPLALGHPLHPSTLAYVFKVLHMKGRGGSGDGRVAFARVYSGKLKARDSVRVISPVSQGNDIDREKKQKHPIERIGGMLELSGGRFDNLQDGSCSSGDVCALVGLKSVVTGDTLLLTSAGGGADAKQDKKKSAKNRKNDALWKQYMDGVHLAGLASPRPVLTIRVEASSSSDQSRLSDALALLAVEDPSLVVEETPTTTLISGLGELHMEIVLDRLRREFGVEVRTGRPAVAYRETVLLEEGEEIETDGMVEYDRTVGGVRLHGGVRLLLRQRAPSDGPRRPMHELCVPPEDPIVTLSPEARVSFDLDPNASPDEDELKYPPPLRALLSGARGSLKRGRLGPYPLANLECGILEVESELSSPDQLPGAMRAAAANAVAVLLESLADEGRMAVLEPRMSVEVSVPTGRVGDVLSDLTGRRGTVDDVLAADEGGGDHAKSVVQAEVPLVEILGYANSLRSLTGGEGAFSAEYKGHLPRDGA